MSVAFSRAKIWSWERTIYLLLYLALTKGVQPGDLLSPKASWRDQKRGCLIAGVPRVLVWVLESAVVAAVAESSREATTGWHYYYY